MPRCRELDTGTRARRPSLRRERAHASLVRQRTQTPRERSTIVRSASRGSVTVHERGKTRRNASVMASISRPTALLSTSKTKRIAASQRSRIFSSVSPGGSAPQQTRLVSDVHATQNLSRQRRVRRLSSERQHSRRMSTHEISHDVRALRVRSTQPSAIPRPVRAACAAIASPALRIPVPETRLRLHDNDHGLAKLDRPTDLSRQNGRLRVEFVRRERTRRSRERPRASHSP